MLVSSKANNQKKQLYFSAILGGWKRHASFEPSLLLLHCCDCCACGVCGVYVLRVHVWLVGVCVSPQEGVSVCLSTVYRRLCVFLWVYGHICR